MLAALGAVLGPALDLRCFGVSVSGEILDALAPDLDDEVENLDVCGTQPLDNSLLPERLDP